MKMQHFYHQTLPNGVHVYYRYVDHGTRIVAVASSWPLTDAYLRAIPRRKWLPFDTGTLTFVTEQ
jgi:hypothetical protein